MQVALRVEINSIHTTPLRVLIVLHSTLPAWVRLILWLRGRREQTRIRKLRVVRGSILLIEGLTLLSKALLPKALLCPIEIGIAELWHTVKTTEPTKVRLIPATTKEALLIILRTKRGHTTERCWISKRLLRTRRG